MQGRKCFTFAAILLALAGCSSKDLLKADCHSCTVEEQGWPEFSWKDLSGHWRGSVEFLRNEQGAGKKAKNEKQVEFTFLRAEDFLKARGVSCASLPAEAVVANGLLWENGSPAREFEAFVPVEDGKVAYGRVSVEKMNGQELCSFRRYGRVMGKNRLSLPAVSFSERGSAAGRGLASTDKETEVSVEFLRFVPEKTAVKVFDQSGRRPASAEARERPPLMLRVFKVSAKPNGDRGEWSSTEEHIYRLWKVER